MNIWCMDFETFFSDEYTLKKLSTEHYIRDPRFEALMLAVREPQGKTFWVPQEQIQSFLNSVDWSTDAILAHHAHFDLLILSHHFGVRPRFIFDTLSMARLVHGNHLSVALGSLARHYGLADKSVPYELFKGKRWADIMDPLRMELGTGACHDVALTWDIFGKLAKDFPVEEYGVIDATIRMFTEPVLSGDAVALEAVQQEEQERKYLLLNRLGVGEGDLQSADRFCQILENLGVEVEYKEGKNGPIPAIAKTDDFMKSLEGHADETISTLAAARLEVRSTIDQTRAGRLLGMAQRGPLPVYLSYAGAHTTRWSGGDKVNLQNLPRGGAIRKAIAAPAGCLLAVVDASQIECRILNYVAGQTSVLEAFASGRDLYCENASRFYGRTITKADKLERGLGKTLELGAGYGLGWKRLQAQCHIGAMGSPPVDLTDQEAQRGIDVYRNGHPLVVCLWKEAEILLRQLASRGWMTWRCGMIAKEGRLYGPNGTWLDFTSLEWDEVDRNYRLKTRKGWSKYYGAKLVENCLSAATLVLTHKGWRRIDTIEPTDMLWDGARWVRHRGAIKRGVRETRPLSGVWMTADHKVLTDGGWVRAAQAGGLRRSTIWLPYGAERRWEHRAETPMESALRLRGDQNARQLAASQDAVLRVQAGGADFPEDAPARDVKASGARGMDFHAGQVPATDPSRLGELRGAGHQRLRTVEELRELLGRYGPNLPYGPHAGPGGQLERVRPGELPLGDLSGAGAEYAQQPDYPNPMGAYDCEGSRRAFGAWGHDPALPTDERLSAGQTVPPCAREEETWDILDCGPDHRFMVCGNDGPFIVHNCIQYLARLVMSQAMLRVIANGYKVASTTHDELIVVIPDDGNADAHVKYLEAELALTPQWMPGIPLAAEGHASKRYEK